MLGYGTMFYIVNMNENLTFIFVNHNDISRFCKECEYLGEILIGPLSKTFKSAFIAPK